MHLTKAPESTNVCFTLDGAEPERVTEVLTEQQRAMVGYAHVEGTSVIRLALGSGDTTPADIDQFFDDVLSVRAELAAA